PGHAVQLQRQQALVVQTPAVTRLVAAAVLALLAFAPAASAQDGATYDQQGHLVSPIPFTPKEPVPSLTEAKAVAALLAAPKVKDWVARYPKKTLVTLGTYEKDYRDWNVGVWS